MTENDINWDEALTGSGKFVKFTTDEQKTLVLTNHRLERNADDAKFSAGEIAFKADVIEEDGETCEKTIEVNSNRLKKKLRPIFENKSVTDKTKLTVMKVGDKFETQYAVKEIK